MSAIAQQQQQSQQVQQPTQQQGAQQGPVPEAGAFGSDNAVEYQGAYGNGAVAGMAGVEGGEQEQGSAAQGVEGADECVEDSFVSRDPELSDRVMDTLSGAEAALGERASWSKTVPESHKGTIDTAAFGLAALVDYMHDAIVDADRAAKDDDDEAFADARWVLEALEAKLRTATQLLDAYAQHYQGMDLVSLAATGKSIEEHMDALADFTALQETSEAAKDELARSVSSIAQGLQDMGEVAVQMGLQTVLSVVVDTLVVASASCGPAAPACAALVVAGGAVADLQLDAKLGTDPEGAAAELVSAVGTANTLKEGAQVALNAQRLATGSKAIAKFVPALGQALILLDGGMELQDAELAVMRGCTDTLAATHELMKLSDEADRLRDQHMAPAADLLETLPADIELASVLSEMAAGEIASILAQHGGSLYDPV